MKTGLPSIRACVAALTVFAVGCGGSNTVQVVYVYPDPGPEAVAVADAVDDDPPERDAAVAEDVLPDPVEAAMEATDPATPDPGPPDPGLTDPETPDPATDADAPLPEAIADTPPDGADADVAKPPEYSPDKPGKYPVGYYHEDLLFDSARTRVVPFHVWYPALAPGAKTVNYMITNIGLLPGGAYENVPPAKADGPFPLILFSHGFKGIAFQSFSLTEFLASHGFVVVAPNHQGNTLLDFGFTKDQEKQTVANVTLLRPGDIGFVYQKALEYNGTAGHVLQGMVNGDIVAMTGHSFGAFTALIVAGAEADMDRAKAACAAGVQADVMCPYVGYYDPGTMLRMDPKIPGLKVLVALTPGGYNAIFDDNLAKVGVPALVMGGSEDTTCPVPIETRPIYDGLPKPKALAVLAGAGHMSYTNVCTIPLVGSLLGDMCKMSITEDRAFQIINAIVTATIRRYALGETAMDAYLDPAAITKAFAEVDWTQE